MEFHELRRGGLLEALLLASTTLACTTNATFDGRAPQRGEHAPQRSEHAPSLPGAQEKLRDNGGAGSAAHDNGDVPRVSPQSRLEIQPTAIDAYLEAAGPNERAEATMRETLDSVRARLGVSFTPTIKCAGLLCRATIVSSAQDLEKLAEYRVREDVQFVFVREVGFPIKLIVYATAPGKTFEDALNPKPEMEARRQ